MSLLSNDPTGYAVRRPGAAAVRGLDTTGGVGVTSRPAAVADLDEVDGRCDDVRWCLFGPGRPARSAYSFSVVVTSDPLIFERGILARRRGSDL